MIGKPDQIDRGNFTYFNYARIDGDQNNPQYMQKYFEGKNEPALKAKIYLLTQICFQFYGKTLRELDVEKPHLVSMLLGLTGVENKYTLYELEERDKRDYLGHVSLERKIYIVESACEHIDWALIA